MKNFKIIKEILEVNTKYIISKNYQGWDPYDVKQIKLYRYLIKKGSKSLTINNPSQYASIFRKILFLFEEAFPITSRKLFFLKPEINYKGLGLFGLSLINQWKLYSNQKILDQLTKIVDLLLANNFSKYMGKHWGYPFDWQSRIFIPKNTPSGVVTSVVGNFFLNLKNTFNTNKYDEVLIDIGSFFINSLNKTVINEGEIVFSYTPLDKFRIHNANLFVADYLMKIGYIFEINEYINYGKLALNYTIKRINDEGKVYYHGDDPIKIADNYHTGFIIRTLMSTNKYLNDKNLDHQIQLIFRYYYNHFFNKMKFPKMLDIKVNPIDIHSISESILVMTLFRKDLNVQKLLDNILEFTIKKMYTPTKGYFFYRAYITKNGNVFYRIKIPYMRWGQAWMNYALSNLLLSEVIGEGKNE